MSLDRLLAWSQDQHHTLPWRVNRSLYRTLVSEIMLQQTTVGTVKNHFDRFLVTFPTLESLAKASEEELLVAWKGLGYYRRARSLKKIAEAIARDHQGKFPKDVESLQKITGIGLYTANALSAIGMDERGLAVDANLERVLARYFGVPVEKGLKLQKELHRRFQEKAIFGNFKGSYRALNEALMDLGRTFCQARKASCELCPLRTDCLARKESKALTYPVMMAAKKKDDHELELVRLYLVKGKKLLTYKKEEGEWLSGQYEVPTFVLRSSDPKLKQYPSFKKKPSLKNLPSFKSGITKYKIINSLWEADQKTLKSLGFTRKLEWREYQAAESNLTTTTLKGLKLLGYIDN